MHELVSRADPTRSIVGSAGDINPIIIITMAKTASSSPIKKTGTFKGKSNELGHGGRAAQLAADLAKKGVPAKEAGAIIGARARAAHAAPGQKNFHGKRK